MKRAGIFESEKNKLTYDMEIEAMYLVGDFGIDGIGSFEDIPHDASFFDGTFRLVAPRREITLEHIERQGYLFFAGELTVRRELTLKEGDTARRLVFRKQGINAIRVRVNGQEVTRVLWAPYEVDLTPYLHAGANTLELTLVNNLRNLLGPHHHVGGELYAVAPRGLLQRAVHLERLLRWLLHRPLLFCQHIPYGCGRRKRSAVSGWGSTPAALPDYPDASRAIPPHPSVPFPPPGKGTFLTLFHCFAGSAHRPRAEKLNITIDFSVFVCYNAFCMQSDRRSPSGICGGLSNLWKGRGRPASLRAVSAKGRGVA